MSNFQIMYLFIAVGATFGFIYAFINLLRNKKGYFYSFAVLGLFGFAMGRIFMFFLSLINFDNIGVFSIGSLGTVSGFLCMAFACNTVEKTDCIEVENIKKYKIIALIMPVMYVVSLVFMILRNLGFEAMILSYIYSFSVVPCSYFCLRNCIAPYPKKSFMHCMRPFFITILVFCITALLSELSWLFDEKYMTLVSVCLTVCGTVCYIAMAIFLERGNRKWNKM